MESAMRAIRIGVVLFGVISALSANRAVAQSGNETVVETGTRVRFTLHDAQSPEQYRARRLVMKGTVTDIRSDSLLVQLGGSAHMTVSRSSMSDLSISRGTERAWRSHPVATAVNGALVAGSVVLFTQLASQRPSTPGERNRSLVPMAGLLSFNTALFVRNAFRRTERWERISQ
jgi:hypothetical protein